MADNVTLDPGAGGDTVRTKDRTGTETQIVGLDLTVGGVAETLMNGSMPVNDNSGSLTVDDGNGSLTVDGPLTDVQLRASPVPVTIPSPTPVTDNSGSLTVDAPVATPVASRLSDGAAFLTTTSGRLAVDASGVAVPVTDNASSLTVDAPVGTPVFVRLSDGAAALIGQKVMATSLPVVVASDQSAVPVSGTVTASGPLTDTQLRASAVPVSAPTLTKGTQAANGWSVQNLKDAGRSQIMLSWEEMAGTAAAESSLTNFTLGSKAAAALTAATNYAVTAGKTLRIQEVHIYTKATSTVNNLSRFRIRQAASVANNSPVIWDAVLLGVEAPGTIAAGLGATAVYPIPDGLEVAASQQIAFTWFTAANTCTVGMTIVGYEY